MANIPINQTLATTTEAPQRSLCGMLRAWLGTRREVLGILRHARRARTQYGYGHVPRRVWDRRSAWIIER